MVRLHFVDHPQHRVIPAFLRIPDDLRHTFINDKYRQPFSLNTYFTKFWVHSQGVGQAAMTFTDVSKRADSGWLSIDLDQPIVNNMPGSMFISKLRATSHSRNVVLVLRKKLFI